MRFSLLVVAFVLAILPAVAQPADPAFLARAIQALQAQRNSAMDQAAEYKARADGLADDLAKAQARIKELEPKPDAKAPPPNNAGR